MPNTGEFSVCRNGPKAGGRRSRRFPDRLREPPAPPRPAAGESPRQAAAARSPPPRPGDSPTSGERLAPPAPPPPAPRPQACPFVGAERWRQRRKGGAQDRSVAPPWEPARGRAPRGAVSRGGGGGGRAGPVRRPPPLQLPAASRATSPATLFREISPSRLPVRPRPQPGPSGHRRLGSGERGAQSHLTACPVVERPPSTPSRPVAAGPALSWPRAARARGSRSQS